LHYLSRVDGKTWLKREEELESIVLYRCKMISYIRKRLSYVKKKLLSAKFKQK
jgi:hypothetical protein